MLRFTPLLLLIALIFSSCASDEQAQLDPNLPLSEQIDFLIEENEYETALQILEDEDRDDPEVRLLLEKTHLNYGLHNMNTFDPGEMRTRMNSALVQFAEVLKLNPENGVAREQIQQIMGVYATIPERSPDEEVLEKLREVGFDY